jgi:UDP-glucose 4-epimerase
MIHSRYGVVNWFIRQAIDDQTIKVFGDGEILRDFLYIDDCVDSLLLSASCDDAVGEIFNVGYHQPTNFIQLADTIIQVTGSGRWEFAPFTEERKAQEPGSFYSDIRKIQRIMGWNPKVDLFNGVSNTVAYYKKYKEHYWT